MWARPITQRPIRGSTAGQMDELKALLATYDSTNPTEATVADDINFALSQQSMTIEEREDLLNTKIRQIEMA